MGDRQRHLWGQLGGYLTPSGGGNAGAGSILYWHEADIDYRTSAIGTGYTRFDKLTVDSSRTMPTGAANVPRSWGSLAYAYLGQQS